MKKIIGLILFVTLFLSVNAQTMLDKGQSGVILAGNMTTDSGSEGLGLAIGYSIDGIFDLGLVGGRTYAKTTEGHFNSDLYENYWGLECSVWFLNKEISSETSFKSGLLAGVAYGNLNKTAFMMYDSKSTQGYGGLEVLLNYNPGNDFFIFQPYINAAYTEGKLKYFQGDNLVSSASLNDWIFSAGVSFGFRFPSGNALSLTISKSYLKEADASTLGFGIQYDIPTEES